MEGQNIKCGKGEEEVIRFDTPPSMYWNDITKVNHLQRKILLCSITYYKLNDNCMSDFEYDSISKQLVKMQKEMEKSRLKQTMYYYVFKDFEGSTGFDLIGKLKKEDYDYLFGLALYLLRCYKSKEG